MPSSGPPAARGSTKSICRSGGEAFSDTVNIPAVTVDSGRALALAAFACQRSATRMLIVQVAAHAGPVGDDGTPIAFR